MNVLFWHGHDTHILHQSTLQVARGGLNSKYSHVIFCIYMYINCWLRVSELLYSLFMLF